MSTIKIFSMDCELMWSSVRLQYNKIQVKIGQVTHTIACAW